MGTKLVFLFLVIILINKSFSQEKVFDVYYLYEYKNDVPDCNFPDFHIKLINDLEDKYAKTLFILKIDSTNTTFYLDKNTYNKKDNDFLILYSTMLGYEIKKNNNDSLYYVIDFSNDWVKIENNYNIHLPWKLIEEYKFIDKYKCQKAICNQKVLYSNGYEYSQEEITAWFTKEIPINSGPKCYDGLPGLILELENKLGKFTFVKKTERFE